MFFYITKENLLFISNMMETCYTHMKCIHRSGRTYSVSTPLGNDNLTEETNTPSICFSLFKIKNCQKKYYYIMITIHNNFFFASVKNNEFYLKPVIIFSITGNNDFPLFFSRGATTISYFSSPKKYFFAK